jgi:hypothetical protein
MVKSGVPDPVGLLNSSKVTAPVGLFPVTVALSAIEEPTKADPGCWVVLMASASTGTAGKTPAPTSTTVAGTLALSRPHQLPTRFISAPRSLAAPLPFVYRTTNTFRRKIDHVERRRLRRKMPGGVSVPTLYFTDMSILRRGARFQGKQAVLMSSGVQKFLTQSRAVVPLTLSGAVAHFQARARADGMLR